MSSIFSRRTPGPREVIARLTGVPLARLRDDLALSWLVPFPWERTELLIALEEECGLELSVPDDVACELLSLGDLLACLRPRQSMSHA